MVGVEVAHTYYGCVTLSNDKEAPTSTQCLKHMRLELESMSSDNLKLRRVHHDVDGSFDGEFKQYLLDNTIVDTDTGGHRPNNNAHTERRNKKLKESFKAMLYNATGGGRLSPYGERQGSSPLMSRAVPWAPLCGQPKNTTPKTQDIPDLLPEATEFVNSL